VSFDYRILGDSFPLVQLRALRSDKKGSAAPLFGLTALVMIQCAGSALDYSHAVSVQGKIQQAVDAAALAGASALANGKSTQIAQTVANTQFVTNAPANALAAGSVTFTPSSSGAAQRLTVAYSGSVPTSFMKLAHIDTIATRATATAEASASSTTTTNTGSASAMTYAGNGSVAGDPHIAGADGSSGYLQCATPSGSWYNLLSDSGIQVNVSCVSYTGVWLDVVQSFSILLGTHVISLTAPSPTFDSSGNASYDINTAWFGQITIDGVTYAPVIGSHSYLGGMVKTNITDLTNFYKSDNMVHINNGTYDIYLTFDAYAMGDINITATNAGKCGVPGGFWGGTLGGKDDYNGSDFLVSGPTAKAPEFSWSTCTTTTTTAAVAARLVN
jgi:hypothetical protein